MAHAVLSVFLSFLSFGQDTTLSLASSCVSPGCGEQILPPRLHGSRFDMTLPSRSDVMPGFLMRKQAPPPWPLLCLGVVAVMFASSSVSSAPPPQAKVLASQRRNDLTAGGSFHRIGMLRQQQRTRRMIEKQAQAPGSKKK